MENNEKVFFITLIAVLLISVNIKKIEAAVNIDRHTNSTLGIDLSVGVPIFTTTYQKLILPIYIQEVLEQ